jgi:penicillin amidase
MKKLKNSPILLRAIEGEVRLSRNEFGIPIIEADSPADMFFGIGWVQAFDRPVELELTRLIAKGVASQFLEASEDLINGDIYMRRYNLWGDSKQQAGELTDESRAIADAFCAGINTVLDEGSRPFEFKLISHRPSHWSPADCIMMTKLIGLIDMTETQGWMEKLIVQMLQSGVSLEQLRELFPYLTDEPDDGFLEIIRKVKLVDPLVPEAVPWTSVAKMKASNNWVVSGDRTASGKPILCGDPHLDSARLPAIWHEMLVRSGDFWFAGCTVPGIPIPALGRTDKLAWSPTYGYMDTIDYFVEEVRDGKYRRGEEWRDFTVREEKINLKKGEPRTVRFYENEHGVLEGDPEEDGYYLCMAWTLGRGRGADTLNHGAKIFTSNTVAEVMPHFAAIDFCSQNWVCADVDGNIGYHQSGRSPVRAAGCSGLLPVPGWDESYDWKGEHPVDVNASIYNPPEGYIGTANQDMNACARVPTTNLPMGDWRARYIHELLEARTDHTVESMQKMHSKQAEEWMPIIKPLLPEVPAADALRRWDLRYSGDSIAPSVFENIYVEMARLVFGEMTLGNKVMDHILDETILFWDFTGLFDRVLLSERSSWFGGKERDELLLTAIDRGLAKDARPWGEGRRVMMNNIMFAGRLPRFLGFDYGPIEIIGGRATIPQGQIFTTLGGRQGTFSPTFKFITDLSEECIHSTMAGGPSDRRFSKWYTSGVADWLAGRYRTMRPERQG